MVHCFWPGALQLDLNFNYAIFTRLDCLFFRSRPYGCKFYLVFYFFGFAAAIGKWASISLYLLVSMMITCHGQTGTRQMLGARKLSPRSYHDQHQLTFLQCQRFGTRISSRIRNFLKKPMATFIMTLCTLKFLSLTPQYHLPSLLYFFPFP